jgi:enoyl-CoA hydratase/carnithine racemase
MTGQAIGAKQALDLGLLVEVLPRDELLPRAWALAEVFIKQPPLVTRFTKAILTQHIKRMVHDTLGYGLAVEGMAVAEGWSGPQEVEY